MTHRQLCEMGARFIAQKLYHGKEYPWRILIETGFRKENPDVFGFTRYNSVLIECKASRSDFLADKKKPFRQNPQEGVGNTRYYLVNEGVAKPEEMPEGWQLLEAIDENTIRVSPSFNPFGINVGLNGSTPFDIRNATAEIDLMWSWEYRKNHKCLPYFSNAKIRLIEREDPTVLEASN